jgi:DNA-binding Lrp family transcriptional regulator
MYEMDDLDRKIIMILQRGIPIESRPYQAMAEEIGGGVTESEVIFRIDRMKKENIIRRMSGFFDSRKLGYKSMLVAVRPKAGMFDEAVRFINQYPGVTHNYERNHDFSIWFTIIAINQPTLDHILDTIRDSGYVQDMMRFEMTQRYKIDVTFDVLNHRKGGSAQHG